MSATERLPNAELDIMRVLWSAKAPIKASDLTKALSEERAWKRQTVHVLLARLEAKGYVGVDKSAYSHLFYPTITESDYIAFVASVLVEKANSSVSSMMASLINANKLTDEDVVAISELINAKRKEIEESGK